LCTQVKLVTKLSIAFFSVVFPTIIQPSFFIFRVFSGLDFFY